MAFDTKRLKTFKWLEQLASCHTPYRKQAFPRFPHIMAYCDSIYATDEIMLAKIDYPEFHDLTDYEWMDIIRYTDDDRMLLEMPELRIRVKQFNDPRFFDKFFKKESRPLETNIDCKVLEFALKPFKINGIDPALYTSDSMVYLMGHNKDVSMRVCMMGKR